MRNIADKNFDLYDYVTNEIISFMERSTEFDEIEREKLYLGIITLLINGLKTIIIGTLAVVFGIVPEILLMLAVFFVLRLFAAGLHAKKSYTCTIVSIATYFTGAFLSINHPINRAVCFMICILLMAILVKYSPADTENRPLIGKENRDKLKKNTFIAALAVLGLNIIVFDEKIINLTMYSMVMETVCVLPLTYKILNRGYKNYEKYE